MRLGVPRRAGRIGKRVRLPRGRATVKIVANKATMQKPGDLPERRLQLSNASRKGVQAAVEILFSRKDPVASLSHLRGRKSDGILSFQPIARFGKKRTAKQSPRSGRMRIAQQFTAGLIARNQTESASGRLNGRCNWSPVSVVRFTDFAAKIHPFSQR